MNAQERVACHVMDPADLSLSSPSHAIATAPSNDDMRGMRGGGVATRYQRAHCTVRDPKVVGHSNWRALHVIARIGGAVARTQHIVRLLQ